MSHPSLVRALLLALAGAIALHVQHRGLEAQAQGDTLTFFKNYFVTGDYVAAGVGLRGKGVGGLATDTITIPAAGMGGVPDGADIVAAFLYWQVVTTTGSDAGNLGVRFNGYDLSADNPATPVLDREPFGKVLAFAGTAPCYNPGGSTGETTAITWTYRADVLRFFDTNFSGTADSNPNYGKLVVNGAHTVTVPDSGPNGNISPMALGASLVVVYRTSTSNLASIVLYDDGVTLANPQRTLEQRIEGFYQASATPNARITYMVGSGQASKNDYVIVPGASASYQNVFSATDDANWDTLTYPAGLVENASFVETTISNNISGGGGRDCLTPAAIVFKTEVQDTDEDGLLDVWETIGTSGGPDELLDPNGQPLPALGAMGANPAVKDLFVEIGYMGVAAQVDGDDEDEVADSVSYGGQLKPAHTHLPTHAALKLMGDAFKNAPLTGGVRVHFDLGDDYPVGDSTDPENNADEYIIRGTHARGGEAIDEMDTVCTPGDGAPEWECQFAGHPGTVGWKSGYRFLRDQVTVVNGAPAPPGFDPDLCGTTSDGTTYVCQRRFDANRLATFHYALFGHAIGLPQSDVPCLSGDTEVPAGSDDRCLAGTTPNPKFHTPRTNTGIADFPGSDVLITLGGFPDVDGHPIGTPFMQASTLMHEIGHNAERRHGGGAREPNCKPTYLSVMNYLYQLRGLLTDDGMPHLDFAGAPAGATVDESALDGLVTAPPYRLGWYAVLEGSYREGQSQPARSHCNGSAIDADDVPMVRVDARYAADPIDWDADGADGFVSPQDVNFSGAADEELTGSVDWSALKLNQVGIRRNVGGLYLDPSSTALFVGPLSADVGKGDLGKGDLGKGDLGKGDLGKGDLGKGDLGKGDLGKGDLGKGDLGKGDLGGGDLFENDPNNPPGELDSVTAGDLARTPPNGFDACVIGETCDGITEPNHRVQLSWASTNTGGNPQGYQVYRVEGDTLQNGQAWEPVGGPVAASEFEDTRRGIRYYVTIDPTELENLVQYTYFAVAIHGIGDTSDPSNVVTITGVNDPAEAHDDSYEVDEDTLLTVTAPGVLANDGDPDTPGVSLTATLAPGSGPSHAAAFTLNADGSFSYQPVAEFNGTDSFSYRISTAGAFVDTATVNIIVNAVNDPPAADNDSYSTAEDTTLTVPAATGVLAGDSDIDSAGLTAVLATGPAHAQAFSLNADGGFTYTPVAHFNGTDSFTYRASDGEATSGLATATITVTAVNDTPTISAIANRTINWNTTTGPIAFTIGDVDGLGGLTVSGDSSNHTLVPLSAIALNGSGANRTVTVTPATNQFGTASITLTVSDGSASASTSFDLTVNRVQYTFVPVSNLPPTKTKSGSTTSMKWQYKDGSTVIESGTLTHTITVCRVTASGCTPVDTFTNTDSGSSSFRYSSKTWTFNLQTKDRSGVAYPPGEYRLTIQPNDGAYQTGGPYPLTVTR